MFGGTTIKLVGEAAVEVVVGTMNVEGIVTVPPVLVAGERIVVKPFVPIDVSLPLTATCRAFAPNGFEAVSMMVPLAPLGKFAPKGFAAVLINVPFTPFGKLALNGLFRDELVVKALPTVAPSRLMRVLLVKGLVVLMLDVTPDEPVLAVMRARPGTGPLIAIAPPLPVPNRFEPNCPAAGPERFVLVLVTIPLPCLSLLVAAVVWDVVTAE